MNSAFSVSLEKIFFAYLLKNKRYYEKIKPFFFKNPDIRKTYEILRKHVLEHMSSDVPKKQQIVEMVLLEDKDKSISREMLKAILKTKLDELDEDTFIKPKLKTWISINNIEEWTTDVIEETRNIGTISDMDSAIELTARLRELTMTATNTNFDDDDDDLGTDFDIAEEHSQDHSTTKVRSGWEQLDGLLGGGFDAGTLNLLMGATNSGKSLWMQNMAVNFANGGKNVLYISLEMTVKKVLKRLGSMRLKIPINDYDNLSSDTEYMKEKIDKLHKSGSVDGGNDLFDNQMGKIITKFYAAGTSTLEQYDKLIKDIYDKKGIKIDVIIVDYLTLIAPLKGMEANLFIKGKHLAEGLRAIAAKYEIPAITAMQVSKDAWNMSDMTLDKIPESKAIAETADTFFAIIRTEEMKRLNIYRLKLLKQRDGDFSKSQVKFDLNTNFLTIENGVYVEGVGG